MNDTLELQPISGDLALQAQWHDKLWACLFDGDTGGLMSPGQIRRERRDREQVRQLEMAAILEAEEELNSVHQGLKTLDDQGNLINTPKIDTVSTHHIIENTAVEQGLDIGLDTPASMIRSVVKEVSVRDLERSLNVRKIAILAESQILEVDMRSIDPNPVDAKWLRRWRECAETVFNPELQMLWAKTVILEVAQPNTFSLGVLTALHQLNSEDLAMVNVAAKYTFPDFIFNASDSYFNTDFHRNLFDVMEDLGLLNAGGKTVALASELPKIYTHVLSVRNKALRVSAERTHQQLSLPILKLTRIGRQVFKLLDAEADLAYLFDMAGYIKKQGFDVAVGDIKNDSLGSQFVEKMKL